MARAADENRERTNRERWKRPKLSWLLLVCVVGAGVSFGYWLVFLRNRVSTDDAYVTADSAAVSSRVAGTISQLMAENDDRVTEGATLVELDPKDYQAEVDKQRAALARIEAEIRASEVNVNLTNSQTVAQLEASQATLQAARDKEQELRHRLAELEQNRTAAEADLQHAKRDFERYANLFKEGAGSEQQRDRASTAFKKANAQFEAADAQIAGARASLAAAVQEIDRAKAQRNGAKASRLRVEMERNNLAALKARRVETLAQLQMAELKLSYCTIKAPISGYVAQRRIQVGERIEPGQTLLNVVPLKEVYVEANFKETQLEDVRIGQRAEIEADIYPGHTYEGKVAGIRAGTGAAFSLLPPENATGNWIKVVQRIPVRIELVAPPPPKYPLRVGASLDVTIFTADRSGPLLRLSTIGGGRPVSSRPPP
jgi:membrane fusion protein (multidrug efflux system)